MNTEVLTIFGQLITLFDVGAFFFVLFPLLDALSVLFIIHSYRRAAMTFFRRFVKAKIAPADHNTSVVSSAAKSRKIVHG